MILAVLLLVWSTAAAPSEGVAAATAPRTHVVTIDASKFSPARLTVAPGDTIVWKNADMFPHTATSTVGAFDSGEIAPGKSWSYKAARKGVLDYLCTLHPSMKGSVRIR